MTASLRALQGELKSLTKQPLEGVTIDLVDDNAYKWEVGLFGPPETIYQGGYFKARLDFPPSYPFEPPKMYFLTDMFHPNVYPSGEICISILHPPGDDEMSGERPEERWNPTQQVRTILLSVISLLNEPNTSSPANVDASVSYRKFKNGEDDAYEKKVLSQVQQSREVAEQEGVEIPTTLAEYCIKHKPVTDDQDDWGMNDSIASDNDYGDDFDGFDSGEFEEEDFEMDDD